ncbi:uncharacterized protein LOC123510418 isoform X2 [Portunus trituberculatus]|uniref:uncharacterized protein LOC123510418 isoform X2 n=1 Tax=Portunus trituberculatus TaxID=210409 RepID=UPI001E1D13DE|nr:uncharacterized protein LOC123510418 isoform X2 [Portunus trituberculatus]
MPRYAYQKPVNRQYAYNTRYMNNYYKPLTDYIEKKKETQVTEKVKRAPSEQPGHQSLAERLKTYSMDGTIYRSARASSLPPSRSLLFDDDGDLLPVRYRKAIKSRVMFEDESSSSEGITRARPMSSYEAADAAVLRVDDEPRRVPLWMKHPYRLPVEDIRVPPHESSIWPESVPTSTWCPLTM